jgi:hypothetical protein
MSCGADYDQMMLCSVTISVKECLDLLKRKMQAGTEDAAGAPVEHDDLQAGVG